MAVTNGLFTLPLDFGANFPGADRWLQLEVRTTIGAFTLFTPRQQLTSTPYAITASNLTGALPAAQLSGALASANLAGTYSSALTLNNAANSFTGSGAGLTALNASNLASGTVPDARLAGNVARTNQVWTLGGNSATTAGTHFIGTKDNQPLEIKVNNLRALRIGYATNITYGYSPNLVGGYSGNIVSNGFVGAVIVGGGHSSLPNRAGDDFATVVGGYGNTASGAASTAMGIGTFASGTASTAMGSSTEASGESSTAMNSDTEASGSHSTAMGRFTAASGFASTTMGYSTGASGDSATAMGNTTTASGSASTAMGLSTTASGNYSTAMGRRAKANHSGAFVWADGQNADFASTDVNQFLIRAAGGVGIGTNSPNSQLHINGDGVTPSLRVQVSGLSKLVVATNGGVSVGAITAPPENGLRVSGDVGIGRSPAANALEVAGDASKTTAGNWLANSDARIKTGVHNVSHALEKLAQVRPVEFRYTDEYRAQHPSIEDRPYLNVIAQEFQKVFPEAVKSSGDKLPNGKPILQVDTYPLTIYSAAAIQELNQKLTDELKQKETEMTELKHRLDKLEKQMKQNGRGEK